MIRRAVAADAELMAALHAASAERPWRLPAMEALLAATATAAYLSGEDGFVIVRAVAGEGEILTLAVTPAARRAGRGRGLMIAAEDHARREGAAAMFLEVAADNLAARALYAHLGYAEVGRRRGYYPRGGAAPSDALVLRKDISGG